MPTHNRRRLAEPCLISLCEAIREDGCATLTVVDQNSSDGVREFAEALPDVVVLKSSAATAGALRNEGVRGSTGEWVCFVDSDVLVPSNYLSLIRAALAQAPNSIVGCAYALPDQPHWIERTWDELNTRHGDGERTYLNAGNIALSREQFDLLGGFDSKLSSGEDTDLARRARHRGIRCRQFDSLRAVHLGNPKSIGSFFRKQRWHGEGARLSDLVARAALTSVLADAGAAVFLCIAILWGWSILPLLLISLAFVNLIPTLAYAHRAWSRRRLPPLLTSLLLLHIYFLARASALLARLGRSRT